MTVKRQYFYPTLPATTLAQGMDASQTSCVIQSSSGWTVASSYPYLLTIDRDGANEERVYVNGRSGTTLTGLDRGADSSTGVPHDAGESVEHTLSGQFLNDLADLLDVGNAGQMLISSGQDFSWSYAGLPRFATASARNAANTSPTEGDTCVVTGEDRVYVYTGSIWIPISWWSTTGRPGCSLSRASAQTIANSATANISWTTEDRDLDGWITVTGATLTVPTGHGGIYGLRYGITSSGTGTQTSEILVNGSTIGSSATAGTAQMLNGSGGLYPAPTNSARTGATIVNLAAGDTITLSIANSSGGSRDYTNSTIELTRLAV